VGDSTLADGFRFTLENIDASGFTIQTLLPVTQAATFDWDQSKRAFKGVIGGQESDARI
jgi:hypothetical protein